MPEKPDRINQRPIVTPITQSTTFIFPDTASLIEFQKGAKKGYLYTRYSNPTVEAAEERIAGMEGTENSLLFSSGMAAISSVCMTILKTGDEIISSNPVYGGTAHLFNDLFTKLGIITRYFPSSEISALPGMITGKTRLIYLESPTNPNLQIVDLKQAAIIAREKKIISVVDSTFATPINQRPVVFGLDVVVHSVTKFMGGHSDIMGGVVSSSNEIIKKIYETRKLLGGCMDPHQAFLLERGLRTLEVRMERHNKSAAKIARSMESLDGVEKVIYPGLESHPQHELARDLMNDFGGMVSFDLGSEKTATKFADSLKVVRNAVSLGGVESLVSLPIWTSHFGLEGEELKKAGVTPGLVRLSVGLEDPDQLIEDIRQALEKALDS